MKRFRLTDRLQRYRKTRGKARKNTLFRLTGKIIRLRHWLYARLHYLCAGSAAAAALTTKTDALTVRTGTPTVATVTPTENTTILTHERKPHCL